MTFKKILATIVFISFLSSCKNETHQHLNHQIIPAPLSQEINEGYFILNSSSGINFDVEFEVAANFLKDFIEEGSNNNIALSGKSNSIQFTLDASISNEEGYSLDITSSGIDIKANSPQGAFYAVQSLRQLLPESFENGSFEENKVLIQNLSIKDEPTFRYRGMHLDVGRHMYSVDFIKKYIDAIAMLKMNTFHWHLTEDQGWRVEIKKYPKLQEISAFRNETLIGHYSDQPHQFDGKKYGGFYTQEEIKEVVAYAQQRSVTVIPEIELPGHSQAVLAAYPELGCTGEPIEVATIWGVREDIYCPKEETFTFLEDVLDEVLELFPSEYIHIGGDEAPKTRWKHCNYCQSLTKKEGLKDEHELQSYFIARIEKYLNSKGRQIIGWDEILEGGLAPNATVMSWRGISGAIEAAKEHHNVIMTPTSHCYFDYYQSENEDEPLAIGGFLPLEKVYNFNPIPEELTEEEHKYVLGAQGNVWTEYMQTSEKVEYMMFPRIFAMSEVNWTKPELKDYNNFTERVEQFHKRLDMLNYNYANHFYEIEGTSEKNDEGMFYKLKTPTKKFDIKYTTDNSEPTKESTVYSKPILVDKTTNIKAAVFNEEEKLGKTFSQQINLHKAVGSTITINKQPHKSYQGSGVDGLINGISGSDKRFADTEWLGFWGEDLEVVIDLGEIIDIKSIQLRFHNGQGQWIYAPNEVKISFSESELSSVIKTQETMDKLIKLDIPIEISTEKVFISIPNYGVIPDGKQGAGNKAWTFIDEIIVN